MIINCFYMNTYIIWYRVNFKINQIQRVAILFLSTWHLWSSFSGLAVSGSEMTD